MSYLQSQAPPASCCSLPPTAHPEVARLLELLAEWWCPPLSKLGSPLSLPTHLDPPVRDDTSTIYRSVLVLQSRCRIRSDFRAGLQVKSVAVSPTPMLRPLHGNKARRLAPRVNAFQAVTALVTVERRMERPLEHGFYNPAFCVSGAVSAGSVASTASPVAPSETVT